MRAFTPWVAALFSRSVSVVGEMGSLFMSMDIAGTWSSILVFASLHVVTIAWADSVLYLGLYSLLSDCSPPLDHPDTFFRLLFQSSLPRWS